MPIEQVVFSSARTAAREGYQVVAASPGAAAADLRQLATCCPTHDSLAAGRSPPGSVNYWPLASGNRCLSRTSATSGEYSGRRGPNIETRCLLVPGEVWQRFGANPFVILRAAEAAGKFPRVAAVLPSGEQPCLSSFELPGRALLVDRMLLAQIVARGEVVALSLILDALLQGTKDAGRSVAVAGAAAPELLCAAVLNCLPLEMRSGVSFSTGLVPSRQRPLRLVFVEAPYDPSHTVIDLGQIKADVLATLADRSPAEVGPGDWPRLVYRLLTSRNIGRLAAELERLPADASAYDGTIICRNCSNR